MYGLNRRLAFHHSHAASWPAENEIRIESLACHRVVSRAGGVIDGQHNFGNARRRHRFDEPRARANDSFLLGLGSDHEPRDILHEEKRDAEAVAPIDEVRDLLGAFGIHDSAEARLFSFSSFDQATLIGNDAYRNSINAGVATNHLSGDSF